MNMQPPLSAPPIGPVLMTDAVDAYLTHLRGTSSPARHRECGRLLRLVADLVGPYRVLAEVDDDELAVSLAVLREVVPAACADRASGLLVAWSRWCRSAAMPAPALPAPRSRSGVDCQRDDRDSVLCGRTSGVIGNSTTRTGSTEASDRHSARHTE